MKNEHFISDMAIESAQSASFDDIISSRELAYGIVKRTMLIKSVQEEKRVGRPRGLYITFDCPYGLHKSEAACQYITRAICKSLLELVGRVKRSSPVLVVGLGNGKIVADSLGKRVLDGIDVVSKMQSNGQPICAISTGVLGTTGMQSADIVRAIADKIKPCVVILIDSLATGAVQRLGRSFQLSSTGISPGSGVGQDKERIDKAILSVPVYSIGVPLLLSLRTELYAFVKELVKEEKIELSELALRQRLAASELGELIVAPRDIDFLVQSASQIVSDAINMAFKA